MDHDMITEPLADASDSLLTTYLPYDSQSWVRWDVIRAHACTLALSLGLPATWDAPRLAYRHGAVGWAVAHVAAVAAVALPVAIVQLAIGQLSQQDVVGVWRVVPFFKGIGYLRLLISFLTASYSLVYIAVIAIYLLRIIFNPMPFWACADQVGGSNESIDDFFYVNESSCLTEILSEPVGERPEFYLGLALVIIALWFVFPFLLYSPTKMLKRMYYVLGPLVAIIAIVIVSCIGESWPITSPQEIGDWPGFLEPDIWQSALVQALWASQVAGGFLVTAGGTLYSDMNIHWAALVFVIVNTVATWLGVLFWLAIGGRGQDGVFVLLAQLNDAAEKRDLNTAWSATTAVLVLLSGVISMLALLYPIYDRFRRVGGIRWRMYSIGSSLLGIPASLAIMAGGVTSLDLIQQVSLPFLISTTTVLEVLTLVLFYGARNLLEDIAFLTERDRGKLWIWWLISTVTLIGFTSWWVTAIVMNDEPWPDIPWVTICAIVSAALVVIIVVLAAGMSVATQDQFDCCAKLQSSLKPSRHWGPSDPITHYYWLSRREEIQRGNQDPRIHRRTLGQLSGRPRKLIDPPKGTIFTIDLKRRNNSDDYVYTVYRKKCIEKACSQFINNKFRFRSKSLD